MKVEAEEGRWGLGNVSGGGGGLGLCRDDGGHEHYLKGVYDNNERKKFTNAKYNSPFLFLCLNSWTEWLTRWLLKSYKQGRHQLWVEEWELAMRRMCKRCEMCKRCGTCKRCRMNERCRTNRWMRKGDAVHTLTCIQHVCDTRVHALSLKTKCCCHPCPHITSV